MKAGFYPKLAWDGIRKNKRLYFPYILTGCVMVMMFYIMSSLSHSPSLEEMSGGDVLMTILPLGCIMIAVFSLLFLFYTNSFLIKQRYHEFGLYNVLGMDKKNICKVMVWETLFTTIASISAGLIIGIVLSKAAELVLLNLLHMEVTYTLSISTASLIQTSMIYGVIFLLLLVNSLIRVSLSKPLELIQSSKVGERVLKRTWIFALVGIVLLGAAYFLAVSIEEPLTAFIWFFISVILVILGTYLLFIAGSVVFCKLLQKNKRYYYQPRHFVSVSSMVYRMKRNGAGLASICILLTMVLVMISSTTSLYFGTEDSLKNRYPHDINISVTYNDISGISDENVSLMENQIKEHSGKNRDFNTIRSCNVPGMFTKEGITIDLNNVTDFTASSYDNVGQLSVISLDNYNSIMNAHNNLADDECFIFSDRINYEWDTFTMEYGTPYKVKTKLDEFPIDEALNAMVMPTVYLVVKDLSSFSKPIWELKNEFGEPMMLYDFRCGFEVDTVEQELLIAEKLNQMLSDLAKEDSNIFTFTSQSREVQRDAFYNLYGSLFFLGIMLSIVFLLAAVLIIYYKQISEGYEDYSRFDIMQKIGMTKRDIRKNINSQMLTVFFAPLLLAGIHLAFAFPFIMKIFKMFAFNNTVLGIIVTLSCFAAFGLLYAIVYKITSVAYYSIVSGTRNV